jgi:hypothetical protein
VAALVGLILSAGQGYGIAEHVIGVTQNRPGHIVAAALLGFLLSSVRDYLNSRKCSKGRAKQDGASWGGSTFGVYSELSTELWNSHKFNRGYTQKTEAS